MEKIIGSLNSPGLIKALDDNNISFWSSFGKYPGGIIYPDPDFFWTISKIPLYSYNGVLRSRLSRENFLDNYTYIIKNFGEGDFPLIWWLGPHSSPPETSKHLAREGWKNEGFFPAMAGEITKIGETIPFPRGFSIKPATSLEERKLWVELMSRGMGFSEKVTRKAVLVDSRLPESEVEKQKRFIGFLGEKPVATSLLLPDSGVAGIFGVATLPEKRGLGIATVMTQMALLEGKKLGYSVATLVATSLGLPVYEKLGFKRIFSYHCFSWNE